MNTQNLGCCGLDCETCPVLIATVTNDDELRQKTAQEWSILYADFLSKEGLTKDDMNCSGCQSEKSVFVGCTICPIRECCRTKELSTCAICVEYSTCEMLNGFYTEPSNQSAKDNLDRIRTNR